MSDNQLIAFGIFCGTMVILFVAAEVFTAWDLRHVCIKDDHESRPNFHEADGLEVTG